MKILVTGAAGFIGFHLSKLLLEKGHNVIGIDNINDYYDINLKLNRLNELGIDKENAEIFLNKTNSSMYQGLFEFRRMNLEDRENLSKLFEHHQFDAICNLAAQAGVRYSIDNPQAYIDSNIQGFMNILECSREFNVKKVVYASSSSVYGNSLEVPFQETHNVDKPISLYAATKKANELMAHTYSHLYKIQTIGLRFFTVYGPWGRPDMAMFLFTDAILNDKPIKVFNKGNLSRDFTYIDDIVQGVFSTIIEKPKDNSSFQLYNIGNNAPVKLIEFISEIEKTIGKKAIKKMMPMQQGDVKKTWADVSLLKQNYKNFDSTTNIEDGIQRFVNWYIKYYKK